ncbi:MAG: three-Cys-motif partner protein TcmP, partial [Thermoleophilia bacterium]|nr:three-Cys-motif partner protein TcmP [Thermoleophilia bacterium]
FDEVGPWTEIKLEIIRKYAAAYSTVLAKQPALRHIYVDAFASSGLHRSKETGELIQGSPLVALSVKPPFHEYHFIELKPRKTAALRSLIPREPHIHIYTEDCNQVLLRDILPRCRYKARRRALWLLDPNGIHYHWRVVEAAGREGSIELLMNFSIMDIHRTVGTRDPSKPTQQYVDRMTLFWGDESWREVVHSSEGILFPEFRHKASGQQIVDAYCRRLRDMAGFCYVPKPLLITDTANHSLYYIVFASKNATGNRIASDILRQYRS